MQISAVLMSEMCASVSKKSNVISRQLVPTRSSGRDSSDLLPVAEFLSIPALVRIDGQERIR